MPYLPALDGLRAVAVLAVMVFHAKTGFATGGFLGVDVFFVLSGYLITRLLLAEHQGAGRIAIGAFYLRRALRLYPALLLMLAAYLLAAPWLFPEASVSSHARDALLAGTYLSDYSYAFFKEPFYLNHTWSLAAEEHFYLLWPLLLGGMLRFGPAMLIRLLAGLLLLAMGWRWFGLFEGQDWQLLYYRFDTRLSGLVMGSLLAVCLDGRKAPGPLQSICAGAGLAALGFAFVFFEWRQGLALAHGMLLVEIGTICLLAASEGALALKLLGARPMVFLGRLSYGLYLWHYPVMLSMRGHMPGWAVFLVGFVISFLFAWFSHATVETWARRFRPDGARAAVPHIKSLEISG